MKFFSKYENKINNLLIKVTDKIYNRFSKYIPSFYFDYKKRLIDKREEIKLKIKNFIIAQALRFKEKVIIPAISFDYIGFFNQKKEQVLGFVRTKKNEVLTKDYWKQKLKEVKGILLLLWNKIKNLNFTFILSFIVGVAASYYIGLFIYEQILNYIERQNEEKETIYTEEELGPPHPEYYKEEFRTFTFYSILMPVYFENNFVRTVLLTFTVVNSNRYITNYFRDNEIEIRNALVSNIRLMDTGFLMTPQGKKVIKDKVRFELNKFLKMKKIRGEVEEVLVYDILTN